jgi:hypothetical protein
VDDLAYGRDGDRAVDRHFARRKSSQRLIAIPRPDRFAPQFGQ